MHEIAEQRGGGLLRTAMAEILDYSERRTRAALGALPDGRYEAEDALEDDLGGGDLTLRLAAIIEGDRLTLDFAGTDPQTPGNLNCPLSVTKSAAFFAVRVLTDPDAPPSAGAHRPIEVAAPESSVLNARFPAAVAAGNVETSSRVADLVLEALAGAAPAPAQGQGTMNNLTLAGEGFTYYETIGGGQGACPGADGPAAIHVAMSNTLNTPVEALETEFPLRVRELSVRRGSGGSGRRHGGDGVIREVEALVPAEFTLITERRRRSPSGRDGGEDGVAGRNLLNGEAIPSKAAGELRPGDRLRIETPGGGGYGRREP
jgi:N-methylhydantoinase B